MYKYNYKNPMTKVFQCEYALYVLMSELFQGVECSSRTVDTLRLYYAELVKVDNATGTVSYKKQEEMEDEIKALIDRDVKGHVNFPAMDSCRAEVSVRQETGGSHSFVYSDGVYGFTLKLGFGKNKKPVWVSVANHAVTAPIKGVGSHGTKEENAALEGAA